MDPKAGDMVKVDGNILLVKHGKKFAEKTGEVNTKTGKDITNPVWKGHYFPIARNSASKADRQAGVTQYRAKNNDQRTNVDNINLQPVGEKEEIAWEEGEILIGGRYKANLAIAGEEEGEVKARHMVTKTRRKASAVIWGEDIAFWERLHQTLGWQKFWEYVKHPKTGAPGVTEKEQFHIPTGQWRDAAKPYATLVIDTPRVQEVFRKSAQRIGEDLTDMFEQLAELTDNIGRFFLSSCGSKKCSKTDAANRGHAGIEAKQNATDLQVSVNKSVEKMEDEEPSASPLDYQSAQIPPEKQAPPTPRGAARTKTANVYPMEEQTVDNTSILKKLIKDVCDKNFSS